MKKTVFTLICLILLFQGCANLPVVPKTRCLYELNEADSYDHWGNKYNDGGLKVGNIPFDKQNFIDEYNKFPETKEKYETGKGNESLGIGMIVAGLTGLGVSWSFQILQSTDHKFNLNSTIYTAVGIALSSVLLNGGIGFAEQAQNDYMEGIYLFNALNNREEFSKKRTKQCADYLYPTIDYWGNLSMKAYFHNQTLQLNDEKILSRLVKLDPEYVSLNEKASRTATIRVLAAFVSPVLGGLALINHYIGSFDLQNQYKAYLNAINIYDEDCFCEKKK